jgi:hypothetical protein
VDTSREDSLTEVAMEATVTKTAEDTKPEPKITLEELVVVPRETNLYLVLLVTWANVTNGLPQKC